MNPLHWNKNHQVALAIAAVIGVVIGVIVGYVVYAVGRGADGGMSFGLWVNYPHKSGSVWWAIIGAVIGAATTYVKRLLSN